MGFYAGFASVGGGARPDGGWQLVGLGIFAGIRYSWVIW